jgi:hypothetical protein
MGQLYISAARILHSITSERRSTPLQRGILSPSRYLAHLSDYWSKSLVSNSQTVRQLSTFHACIGFCLSIRKEFHKCLKTGCGIENSQLKEAHAIDALLGFLSIAAVRLLALKELARTNPDAPAKEHVDQGYIDVPCTVQKLKNRQPTVRQFWREVARVGGFLARKSDGDPGWQTLWRGMRHLEDWVVGYQAAKKCG